MADDGSVKRRPRSPKVLWLTVLPAGIGFGALSLAIARHEPAYSFAGSSVVRAIAELAAGYALLAAGVASWARRPDSRFGALLAASAFGWFLGEWNNPGIGSALGFTIGLAFYAVAPPLVAHAAFAYPDGRLGSRPYRAGVLCAYAVSMLMLGVLPALLFDPHAQGCGECPHNLLLVHDAPGLFDALNRVGVYLGLVSAIALIALLALRLKRSTPALRGLVWPVLVVAGTYLALVCAGFALSLGRGYLTNDPTARALWLTAAWTLVALSLGVAWSWVRGRRTRSAVARLVVDLAGAPAAGGLRQALAGTLGDPSLQLAYALDGGRRVDAFGHPVTLRGEVTALRRDGRSVAFLSHRQGLLDDPVLVEDVARAARLALENERLQAEASAQLEDLRASRARVIATGDAERRGIERDLHDGAQQRLVAVTLALRLARSPMGPDPSPLLPKILDEAEAELGAALAELRELAHGIFPAVLADEGLAAALDVLAEEAPIPVHLVALPDERFAADVEAAGYYVVAETLRRSGCCALRVDARCDDRCLVLELESDQAPGELIDLEDRVGALDGKLEAVRGADGGVTIRAEIPCAS
jgi:signal transduction histidine kinase